MGPGVLLVTVAGVVTCALATAATWRLSGDLFAAVILFLGMLFFLITIAAMVYTFEGHNGRDAG